MVEDAEKISAGKLADKGRRRVWIAAIMGFLFPGLGQIYNGQIILAAIIFLIITASNFLMAVPRPGLPIMLALVNMIIYFLAIIQAIIRAHNLRDAYVERKFNNWIFYMLALMLGIIVTSFPGQYLYKIYKVENDCMAPDYVQGDIVYINKMHYYFNDPEIEEIVLFRPHQDIAEKSLARVWAQSGADVNIRENDIYLDGYRILSAAPPVGGVPQIDGDSLVIVERDMSREFDVPDGSYLLMGDNALGWADETCVGIAPKSVIEGRVEYVYFESTGDELEDNSSIKLLFYHIFFH